MPDDDDGEAMKVAILDDWFDTLRTLACFDKLRGHDVTVFTDHVEDVGAIDLEFVPDPIGGPIDDALEGDPHDAAAVAWHATDAGSTIAALATSAAAAEDAHRAKYTLACIDAAAADPSHRSAYLAAAAYLNAWWNAR